MSGIAHPTGGASRQMGRAKQQEEAGAAQQEEAAAAQQEEGGATQQRGRLVVSVAVTIVALAFVLAHLIWPDLEIDAIALAFVGVAIVPWLGPLLESIEFPGGFKATFREVQEKIQEVQQTTQEVQQTTQSVKDTADKALAQTREIKGATEQILSRTVQPGG
jgi:uncharacterized membrane protein YfbV (UPF0208 family)